MTSAARRQVAAAKGARLPSVELSGSATALDQTPALAANFAGGAVTFPFLENEFYQYRTTVAVPVFTGGKINGMIQAAQSDFAASQAQTATATQDLKLAVADAYVLVLRARQVRIVSRRAEKSLAWHLLDADNLHEQGVVPKNDVLAAKASLANARQSRISADNGLSIAEAAYNRVIGRDLDRPVLLDELRVPATKEMSYEGLVEMAMKSRSEIASLRHQELALYRRAQAVSADKMPQVGVSGGYNRLENRNMVDDGFWSVSVGLQWKLFDGNVADNARAAILHQAEGVSEQRRELATQIALQVRRYQLELGESTRRIDVAEAAVAHAAENLRMIRDRYQEGLARNIQVLDADRLRTESEANLANATYDAVLAELKLRRAVGGL